MTSLFQINDAVGIENRLRALIILGIFCFGKDKIKFRQNLLIFFQISGTGSSLRAEQLQNFFNFCLLLDIQFF